MRIISIFMSILLLTSCSSMNKFFGLKDDNVIEEAAEGLLKNETGLDLDFTPDSPEVE